MSLEKCAVKLQIFVELFLITTLITYEHNTQRKQICRILTVLEKKQEEVQNFSEKGANINFQCKGLPAVKMLSTSKIVHVEPHDTAGSLTQSGLNS